MFGVVMLLEIQDAITKWQEDVVSNKLLKIRKHNRLIIRTSTEVNSLSKIPSA